MEFTFFKDDLLHALQALSLYAFLGQKSGWQSNDFNQEESDNLKELPILDLEAKVIFSFEYGKCNIFICANNMMVGVICDYIFKIGEFSFCLPFADLRKKLEYCDGELIRFEEERFFGFNAFAVELRPKHYVFDIEAYSAKRQKIMSLGNPVMSCKVKLGLIKSIILELAKYAGNDILVPFINYVWLKFTKGYCIAMASDGHWLSYKKIKCSVEEDFELPIPRDEVSNFLQSMAHMEEIVVTKDAEIVKIAGNITDPVGSMYFMYHYVPFDARKFPIEDFTETHEIKFSADINKENLARIARKIADISDDNDLMMLHFINNHVNIHSLKNSSGLSVSEYYEVENCNENFVVGLRARKVCQVLNDIYTTNVFIRISNPFYVFFLNENERIGGDSFRMLCEMKMTDSSFAWLEKRDYELLVNNREYRQKYIEDDI